MSVATSAVERLQDVAGRAGAITEADERATATELNVPVAAVRLLYSCAAVLTSRGVTTLISRKKLTHCRMYSAS